jgi:adenylosuccinate synthase
MLKVNLLSRTNSQIGRLNKYVVLGSLWGDESKGKTAAWYGKYLQRQINGIVYYVRFKGGPNAGHNVFDEYGQLHCFNQIPTGIINQNSRAVISKGVLVDLALLNEEIETVRQKFRFTFSTIADVASRLKVSKDAYIILPVHVAAGRMEEIARRSDAKGTIGRGMTPAAQDRDEKLGIQIKDFENIELLRKKLSQIIDKWRPIIEKHASDFSSATASYDKLALDVENQLSVLGSNYENLQRYRIFVDEIEIENIIQTPENAVIIENTQGALLDKDFGIWPYITPSNTTIQGLTVNYNVPAIRIGVVPAYVHRHGPGPLITEVFGSEYDVLRNPTDFDSWPQDFRVGWPDIPALRYSNHLNSYHWLLLTKLDRLSWFKEIPVCVGYKYNGSPDLLEILETDEFRKIWLRGNQIDEREVNLNPDIDFYHIDNNGRVTFDIYPPIYEILQHCSPVYEILPGWMKNIGDLSRVITWEDLPTNAKDYVGFVERQLCLPVRFISVTKLFSMIKR